MPISPHIKRLHEALGHELVLIPSASALVLDDEGRLLLLRHAGDGNWWGTPGGAIDPYEQPADAAVRETWEECGLIVEPLRLFALLAGPEQIITYPGGDRTSYFSTTFLCRVIGGTLQPDGEEILEARWFKDPLNEVSPIAPNARQLIEMLANDHGDNAAHFATPTWRPAEGASNLYVPTPQAPTA